MLNILVFFALILYLCFILYLINIALFFPTRKKLSNALPHEENVSIVIPCKNEAVNLPGLFKSLEKQIFNANIELIIVDNGSNDTTREIIRQFQQTSHFTLRYIYTDFDQKQKLTAKQQAIDIGVNYASHDMVALSDADMIFSPTWLQSLFASFDNETDMVYGHTALKKSPGFFQCIQSFQLEFLFAIAFVFHYAGIKGSCMGNNIMIRKKTYVECGGQRAIGYTITEDRELFCLLKKSKRIIRIANPFYPQAYTFGHTEFSSFLHQTIRWAKGGLKTDITLSLCALLFSFQNFAFILSPLNIINPLCTKTTFVNFLLTWIMTAILFKKNHAIISPLLFPVYFIFLLLETTMLPIMVLVKKDVLWKGTKI